MDFVSGIYKFDDTIRYTLFPELDQCMFEADAEKKKKKEIIIKKKEVTVYEPESSKTKENMSKQQRKFCDELFGDIIGEKLK